MKNEQYFYSGHSESQEINCKTSPGLFWDTLYDFEEVVYFRSNQCFSHVDIEQVVTSQYWILIGDQDLIGYLCTEWEKNQKVYLGKAVSWFLKQ